MAEIIPGYTSEQKVVKVAATETDINTAITTEAADQWVVSGLTLSGSDIIILFSRTIVTV